MVDMSWCQTCTFMSYFGSINCTLTSGIPHTAQHGGGFSKLKHAALICYSSVLFITSVVILAAVGKPLGF